MKKGSLINWGLAVVSTLVSYVVLETLAWRPHLQLVPLSLHQQLGFLDVLAQPSKAATLPKPGYVAIIGDSYAEGLGDWMMRVVYDGNPDFHAGHLLHRLSGRDVLSFGFRGGYPSFTYGFDTTSAMGGINRYAGLTLPPAGDVVAYFYEGNDVNDQMTAIRFWMPTWADHPEDPGQARRYIDSLAADGAGRARRRWHPLANAHAADTAGHLVKLAYKNTVRQGVGVFAAEDPQYRRAAAYVEDWSRYTSSRYAVNAGGRTLPYPSPTVEPFVFHSPHEIELAGLYFEESLRHLKAVFPGARLWVAYLPSPVNVYDLAQADIPLQDRIRNATGETPGPVTLVSKESLARVSDQTSAVIRRRTEAAGARFIDTRPGLRAAAWQYGYLHGPNDPGHLNRAGYTALADILHRALAAP
jgi:hypothetical protein